MGWLANALCGALDRSKLSVATVARELEIDRSDLGRMVLGLKTPSESLTRRLSVYLGEDEDEWVYRLSYEPTIGHDYLDYPYRKDSERGAVQFEEWLKGIGVNVASRKFDGFQGDMTSWLFQLIESPITALRLNHTNLIVGGGDSSRRDGLFRAGAMYNLTILIVDLRLDSRLDGFKLRTVRERTVPLFGKVKGATWAGEDCGTGLKEALNTNVSFRSPAIGEVGIEVRSRWRWDHWAIRILTSRAQAPSKRLWGAYEELADKVLNCELP